MADSEFEEFRQCFEKLPQHIRAPAPFYSLVPDVLEDDDSPTSSKSDGDDGCDNNTSSAPGSGPSSLGLGAGMQMIVGNTQHGGSLMNADNNNLVIDDNNWNGILRFRPSSAQQNPQQSHYLQHDSSHRGPLPPHCWIPTAPTFSIGSSTSIEGASLASELASIHSNGSSIMRPTMIRRPGEADSSPDSERPYTDVDSGHSTAHSPIDGAKSLSPPFGSHFEMLEPSHRGLHKFVPRHRDEIEVEIGDPIYVQKEADDLWCEGVNLRTGRAGIFPSAYAVDTDYSEFDPACEQARRERYLLGYLGSVETLAHKGTAVVCQATRRVAESQVHACVLEVSDRGLRMVDRTKPAPDQPCIDYFYSLKNVSFCAFHPRDHRYLGFITKHPTLQRFACHVFRGNESTRPVAEAVGRAFQRFYQKFIETAYPIEDIYIE